MKNVRPFLKEVLLLIAGLGIFGTTFCASYIGVVPSPRLSLEWPEAIDDSRYVPTYESKEGKEIAFIYIGSSRCGWSNVDYLPDMVEELKLRTRDKAFDHDRSFTVVGISKDWSVANGVGHLEKYGMFDEIMTGRSWLNEGMLKYVWNEIPGVAATPQILVVERQVEGSKTENRNYRILDERLVARKVGVKEIRQWYDLGSPLPGLN